MIGMLYHICIELEINIIRMSPTLEREPSNYMQELTRYLSNIMNSVLLGLPTEIKELIYFDALSHASTMILVIQPIHFLPKSTDIIQSLPLDNTVKRISPAAVRNLSTD